MTEMLHKSLIALTMISATALIALTAESVAQTVPPDLP
jgi:hypothetical protein